jgi:hypothetical protein
MDTAAEGQDLLIEFTVLGELWEATLDQAFYQPPSCRMPLRGRREGDSFVVRCPIANRSARPNLEKFHVLPADFVILANELKDSRDAIRDGRAWIPRDLSDDSDETTGFEGIKSEPIYTVLLADKWNRNKTVVDGSGSHGPSLCSRPDTLLYRDSIR